MKRTILKPQVIFDVSLVDSEKARQVDPEAVVEVVKAEDLEAMKAEFDADERERLAKTGAAMPDGSFPIRNKSDLHNAMQAIGRAKNPAAAKAHIRKRAAALGLTSELTEAFKAEAGDGEVEEAEEGRAEAGSEAIAQTEVAKAGAEISKKNRGILSSILHAHTGIGHALGALLGQEAEEPEHAGIRDELVSASRQLMSGGGAMSMQKAEDEEPAPTEVAEEEDEMDLTELAKAVALAVTEAQKPLVDAITTLSAQKAEPATAEPVEAEKAAPRVAMTQDEFEEAMALREARKAYGLGRVETSDKPWKLGTPGMAQLREVGKALPKEQRPDLRTALRIATGRRVIDGRLVVAE